jgi:hypothetical protein
MSEYLFLVGEVDPEQYQELRYSLLRRGYQPELRSVSEDQALADHREIEDPNAAAAYAQEVLDVDDIEDVRGIIMTDRVWQSNNVFTLCTSALERRVLHGDGKLECV